MGRSTCRPPGFTAAQSRSTPLTHACATRPRTPSTCSSLAPLQRRSRRPRRPHSHATIAVSTPSGPSSTNRVTPRAASAATASANRTVSRTCRTQYAGSAQLGVGQPAHRSRSTPTDNRRAAWSPRRRPARTRPASAPSAASGTRATPAAAGSSTSSRRLQRGDLRPRSPETTTDAGPFTAATSHAHRSQRPDVRLGAATASIAPPAGSACIRPTPRRHQPARVLQRQHPRHMRGGQLTDRMTQPRSPASPPTTPPAGTAPPRPRTTPAASTPSGPAHHPASANITSRRRPPSNGRKRRTHLVQRRREHRERRRTAHGPSRPAAHPDR